MAKFLAVALLSTAGLVNAIGSCVVGGHDLGTIPLSGMDVNQDYTNLDEKSMYGWSFSVCEPVMQAPAGWTACLVKGYGAQYFKKTCMAAFEDIDHAWSWAGTKAIAQFSTVAAADKRKNIAKMSIECGTTPALKAKGTEFPVTMTTETINFEAYQVFTYTFELTSSVVCGGAKPTAPGATTTPAPTGNSTGGGGDDDKDDGGLPGGFWFILFVGLATIFYVAGTITFYAVKLERRGCPDLVPHREFWMDFPRRCLDGCVFTKDKIAELVGKCRGGGGGGESYEKV